MLLFVHIEDHPFKIFFLKEDLDIVSRDPGYTSMDLHMGTEVSNPASTNLGPVLVDPGTSTRVSNSA